MRPRSSFHRCGLLSSQPKAMIFPSSQSHRPHLPLQSNFIVFNSKKLEALSKGKDRNPEMQVCVSNHDKSSGHLTIAWIHDLEGNIWGTSGQFECGIVFGVEVALGYEEICSDSSGNRVFIRRNNGYMKLIKPFTMENILMSRLCREKMYMEENMFSPFPSHCNSFSRPLVLLMVQRIL
ncbi:PREDICTED: uncharacterized protein LOC106296686 isoform X1 [Brassica oleracea var. oleracea]|uniref:uncharacterized protein LOC106296686 isoform X1 n=1 Tax=Brassica oleracea var. oleracea TaxID=109376 RepID=UPI0006A6A290|nr:PREDICTED: uncharacterized protein LOC106296686 isoform X1 [Brassica oleracea var. oleracea]